MHSHTRSLSIPFSPLPTNLNEALIKIPKERQTVIHSQLLCWVLTNNCWGMKSQVPQREWHFFVSLNKLHEALLKRKSIEAGEWSWFQKHALDRAGECDGKDPLLHAAYMAGFGAARQDVSLALYQGAKVAGFKTLQQAARRGEGMMLFYAAARTQTVALMHSAPRP